jgi:hypothetical protein
MNTKSEHHKASDNLQKELVSVDKIEYHRNPFVGSGSIEQVANHGTYARDQTLSTPTM